MPCGVTVEIAPQVVEANAQAPRVNANPGIPVVKEYIRRATFIHEQDIPSAEWTIHHNLNTYPSVTVVDSAGTVVIGGVQYVNANTVVISFSGAFSGKAYLN